MSIPGGWELVLVLVVLVLLFGAKRLPDASRSLGRSLRIFKAETKGLRDDSSTVPGDPGDKASDRSRDRELERGRDERPPVEPRDLR